MALTLVTNLSYTVFLTTSLSTTLLILYRSIGPVFSLPVSILSIKGFKQANFNFAAKLDVSASLAFLKSDFVA